MSIALCTLAIVALTLTGCPVKGALEAENAELKKEIARLKAELETLKGKGGKHPANLFGKWAYT